MAEQVRDQSDIKETDIVFDCPNCGKSLAIDYRGAGLTIPCTDCGQYVDVPIPDGMEVTDIDSSTEEQEMRILNLRRSLGAAEERIVQLEARIATLETTNAGLARSDIKADDQLTGIRKTVDDVQRQVSDLSSTVRRLVQQLTPEKPDNET